MVAPRLVVHKQINAYTGKGWAFNVFKGFYYHRVTLEIVQQQSLGWQLFQSNFQSFTRSRVAINFDEFQGFAIPFSCLYFADYRLSGISFTKPFTKGS